MPESYENVTLDRMITEQAMERFRVERPRPELYPELYPTRHVTRRCPECGCGDGQHTSVHCPGWRD